MKSRPPAKRVVLTLLAKNMPEHFAGYYLLNSYKILTQEKHKKMESEKTDSILHLFAGEKKKVCYNDTDTVKNEMQ